MKNLSNTPDSHRDMLGRDGALPLADAMARLEGQLLQISPVAEEKSALMDALHRVSSREVLARENLPPLNRSTVDGYAVQARDTFGASEISPAYLELAGEIGMGRIPTEAVAPQHCLRIATGGYLPAQSDAVVMLEHTVGAAQNLIEVVKSVACGSNVIGVGEDLRAGETVIPAGHMFRSQDIGLLAGLGETTAWVHRKVRVGLFSTGDEIIAGDAPAAAGKVRDMNGPMLTALVHESGAVPKWYGIVADKEKDFREVLLQAIRENDLVLFSGGSSVGNRDLGERLLSECGHPGILVHGVAIKPGKPVIVAFSDITPVFGLPGHPVSAAITFDLFVVPTIRHLSGCRPSLLHLRRAIQARLMRNIHSAGGRIDFIRVQLERSSDGSFAAYPVLGKSGALSTLVKSHGFIEIEENSEGMLQGEWATVYLFA